VVKEKRTAYRSVGLPYLRQGNLYQALPVLERAMSLCEEVDLPFYFSLVAAALGEAYGLCGRVDEAVRLLERVLEQTALSGSIGGQTPLLLTLGESHLHAGHLEEAQALAERALALNRERQEHGHEAYALRLLGGIAARREPPASEQAGDYYRQTLALAEALGMRPLQAHCHRGLGTLYATTGQREQARAELSTAIAMYQVMEMTFWLPQTEVALAQVNAG